MQSSRLLAMAVGISERNYPAAAAAVGTSAFSCPDAVLLHLAHSFLLDFEAVRLARTCRAAFHSLRSYKLKSMLPLVEALKFADGSSVADGIIRASAVATTDLRAERAADPLISVRLEELFISTPVPRRSQWRIGMVRRVKVALNDAATKQIGWLPRSVMELHCALQSAVGDSEEAKQQQSLFQHLPAALRILIFDSRGYGGGVPQPPAGWRLPLTLTHLQVGKQWGCLADLALPDGLQTLRLPEYFADAAGAKVQKLPSMPSSLTELDLSDQWQGDKIPPLPVGLTKLNLASYAGSLAEVKLPRFLLRLTLNKIAGAIVDLRLPSQLLSLQFGEEFNGSLEGVILPASLTELHFESKRGVFYQPLEHLHLPAGLRSLQLSRWFNKPIAALQLPPALTHLSSFSKGFEEQLPPLQHTSVTLLDMSDTYYWSESCADCRFPPTLHTFLAPPEFVIDSSLNGFRSCSSEGGSCNELMG